MSIADKITQLTTIRGDIRTALAGKGISASDHDYADFADDIDSISGGGILPATYQQVEYIEATGTQYIDTGYSPTANDDIDATIYVDSTMPTYYAFFGVYEVGVSFFSMLGNNGSNGFTYNRGTTASALTSAYNKKIRIQSFGNTLGYEYNRAFTHTVSGNPISNNYSMAIFSSHEGSTGFLTGAKGRVYSFRIFDAITLSDKRNFIPCYRKADTEIGLYDTVNNQFYTNAGTGTFIKGPDV